MRAAAALLLAIAAPASAADTLVAARGQWAAFADHAAGQCRAISRSVRIASKGQTQAFAAIRFDRQHRRWGGLGVQLSRPARTGSSVILTIADEPFQLVAEGGWAWSSGALQEAAIIGAIRAAPSMRVTARDLGGRRFSDRYLLDGAPTAIDAAAAACARQR